MRLSAIISSAAVMVMMLLHGFDASAQGMSESDQQKNIERISSVTSKFSSIVCDITQTRELAMLDEPVVSKGKMSYLAPGKLRLDYTSPEAVSYIIKDAKITTITGKKRDTADLSANRKVSGMFDFIMTCVTGQCISDRTSFDAAVSMSGNDILVTLTPLKRDIKQMFSSLEITFDQKTCAAKKIHMLEKGGGSTVLVLSNVKTGVSVDESVFN